MLAPADADMRQETQSDLKSDVPPVLDMGFADTDEDVARQMQ